MLSTSLLVLAGSVSVLVLLAVLASLTLAKRSAGNASLEALTVLLEASAFLAIASLRVKAILRVHDLVAGLND